MPHKNNIDYRLDNAGVNQRRGEGPFFVVSRVGSKGGEKAKSPPLACFLFLSTFSLHEQRENGHHPRSFGCKTRAVGDAGPYRMRWARTLIRQPPAATFPQGKERRAVFFPRASVLLCNPARKCYNIAIHNTLPEVRHVQAARGRDPPENA